MSRNDKIALAQILISFGIGIGFTIYSAALFRRDKAAKQLDIDAKNHANVVLLKMFLNNQIATKEQLETEWQFAYMNYRAHH